MPLDPNTGMWSYGQPSYQPGGSSPALGGLLSLVNALQGQQNRQKALAQQQQGESEQVAKNVMSGIYDTPEGQQSAQTLGVSPESVEAIRGAQPAMRLRSAFQEAQAAHPETPLSANEIYQIHLATLGTSPSGMYGALQRTEAETGKMDRAEMAAIEKSVKDAAGSWAQTFRGGITPTPEKVQMFKDQALASAAGVKSGAAKQELSERLDNWIKGMVATGQSPEAASKEGLRSAQAASAQSLADFRSATTDAQLQKILQQTQLMKAHTQHVNNLNALDALAKQGGGVLPFNQRRMAEKEVADMAADQARLERLNTTALSKEEKSKNQRAIDMYSSAIDHVKSMLGEPSGGWNYVRGKGLVASPAPAATQVNPNEMPE